jgi:hypothetical protein
MARTLGCYEEALEILRRLQPALKDIQSEQRRTGERFATLEGRFSGVESQLRQVPTIWQIVGAITAINGLTLAMAFGAIKVLHSL